ncbi:hypothetical protein BGZ97_005444, partial [Linnemannia gamsii]
MHIVFISGLLALASSAFSDVTYSVIGFPDATTNTYAVEIDKEMYTLQTSEATFPLWSASVAGLNNKDDVVVREKFLRHFTNNNATATLNEFFNRQTTITTLPSIKQVYEDTRPKSSRAFDSSQIATIHLKVDPPTFSDMMNNPLDVERKAIKAGFKFINADTVYSVGQVGLKVSGHGSRKNKKVSLQIKFDDDKGETFFDRPVIKLRAQYVDPTMIREKLYLDILNAVGVPTDKKTLGSLFQMGSGRKAGLVYKGPRTANYDPMVYKNKIRGDNPKDEPMQQFIAFMKDLKDWNPAAAGGIAYWNQRLDLEGYLRSMALEYLTGAWDAFWWRGNNYFMYFNPQRKVWQFIPTDFDQTFSTNTHPEVDTT